ncbi:hypothetical protein E1B28_005383 [Marasmius oreades]|uniref:Cytochrome P450 n=1 Tax=Marasmius oreades TaxID=181124 RepID=A0A9P7S3Q5_9AGAR|nr:uncharacterized protein E1B28_005383 [Marasmius oreades]KAG7094555.1 hypothetical protein E1B28_005383 [Marasmius oreades]
MPIMPSQSLKIATISLFLAQVVASVFYRLVFHPLRRFPGPWLAAITKYYRGYYEVFCDGGWLDQLEVLHEKYGPVVRVTPNELHFSDPNAYNDIYVTSRVPKDPSWYTHTAPVSGSVMSEVDPKEATRRRLKLGSYFSRKAVLRLEELVQAKVNKLIKRLLSYQKPTNLHYGYRAATLDIISSYVFAQEMNALDSPDFKHPFLTAVDDLFSTVWLVKYLPFHLDRLPEWISRRIAPASIPLLDERQYIANKIDRVRTTDHDDPPEEKMGVFDLYLRDSSAGVPRWKLLDDGTAFQMAATDTTANACVTGTYHLLTKPDTLVKLRKELDEAWKDTEEVMKYEQLRQLPYLGGVIRECLRLSCGVTLATPRRVGKKEVNIVGFTVPPGTIIGCASYIVHSNPSLFPDPEDFIPERWLGDDSRKLEQYLVAFSKGPRTCLGINLAWCEMYLILANVFRKLDLEIFESTPDSVRFRDYIVPLFHEHPYVRVKGRRL